MTIKDLFENAEGGVLNYEQFMAAAGTAKFADLSEGGYVARQKYADDLAARDTRITSLDDIVKTRDADLAKLQKQLEEAGTDNTKLSQLSTDFADLQKRYDKDTKAYQKQLQEQAYKHAVMDFAGKQNFSSQAAKRDFVNSMLGKNLQMEGDTIIGATDFVTAYTQENADAFVTQDNNPAPAEQKPQPHFVEPTSPTGGNAGDPNAFHFNFIGVRPHDNN